MEFGERYPPAKQAMMKAWEQRIGKLMLGNGDRRTFEVVTAFDGVLEKNQTTIDLFEALDKRHADLAINAGPKPKTSSSTPSATTSSGKYAPDLVKEFERSRDAMQGALHPAPWPTPPRSSCALTTSTSSSSTPCASSTWPQAQRHDECRQSSAEGPEGLRQQEAEAGALGAGRDFHETERIVYFRKDLN